MTLKTMLEYRRAVREYLPLPIDPDIVKECLQLATLAPTSSNMQLYELYHVTNKAILTRLAKACLSQKSATTAEQMVVFVVRPDLHRQRAKAVFEFEKQNVATYSPTDKVAGRLKKLDQYYNYLIPFIYSQKPFVPVARSALACVAQKLRPMQTDLSYDDMRVVIHKSCGLVAQTFMLAMAEQGLDTCPMEGFDGACIKEILALPKDAEINMVISCGLRSEQGVWGERYRVPFDVVYRSL